MLTVGLTFDLRETWLAMGYSEEETAEFDHPATIAAIEEAIQRAGHRTDRIGRLHDLVARLARGDRWDLVFNIAEGLRGIGREAQVPALLDAYGIPYTFSDPLVLALALHKGMTKRVIRDLGLPTPDFAVAENREELESIDLSYPLFVKPVAEGTGKGVSAASRVENAMQLAATGSRLLATFSQPVLVEEYLPGREFTVGLVGTGPAARAVGVLELEFMATAEAHGYTMENKEQYQGRVEYHLIDDPTARRAADLAVAAWRGLGCRDGGRIDIRCDRAGHPSFIEVNPLAGLRPGYSDLPILCAKAGMDYQQLIETILASALERIAGRNDRGRAGHRLETAAGGVPLPCPAPGNH